MPFQIRAQNTEADRTNKSIDGRQANNRKKKKNDGVTAISKMLQPAKSPIGHSSKRVTQP